jgi:hypothetical protein
LADEQQHLTLSEVGGKRFIEHPLGERSGARQTPREPTVVERLISSTGSSNRQSNVIVFPLGSVIDCVNACRLPSFASMT